MSLFLELLLVREGGRAAFSGFKVNDRLQLKKCSHSGQDRAPQMVPLRSGAGIKEY